MTSLELDNRLTALIKKYSELSQKDGELDNAIEELEDEQNSIQNEMDSVKMEIDRLKRAVWIEHDKFTGDEFTDAFIRASYFAMREDDPRPAFEHIKITDAEIMATDSFRGIIVRCGCIPEALKNTLIKWDVRKDFEKNINTELKEWPNLKEVIDGIRATNRKAMEGVKAGEFYAATGMKPRDTDGQVDIVIDGCMMAFNKQYLDDALMVLGDKPFDVLIKDSGSAVLFESKTVTVAVLPLRTVF